MDNDDAADLAEVVAVDEDPDPDPALSPAEALGDDGFGLETPPGRDARSSEPT